jgi:hypothetical protein
MKRAHSSQLPPWYYIASTTTGLFLNFSVSLIVVPWVLRG